MILHIIKDLSEMRGISPNSLFKKLISERLDVALKSYYSDLIYKFDSYNVDEISTKKLVKDVF